jgi:quercetin dioxygenase-like cupin family protein
MSFLSLQDIDEKEIIPGCFARFVHTGNMTLAYWTIKAGAQIPEHSHHHEQIVNLVEGEFELTVAGESRVVKPGDIAVITPNTPHSGRAVTDCRIIDAFYPVREDYR